MGVMDVFIKPYHLIVAALLNSLYYFYDTVIIKAF